MATRRCSMASVLLLCGLCLLASAAAVQGARHSHHAHHRGLRQFRPNPQFPYMRCGNFSSKGLPYYLEGPTWTLDDVTGIATYTFLIGYKGAAVNATPCYSTLEQSVSKLMFHVYTECQPALQVAGMNATLNGKPKAMHVYPTPLGASLTISKLDLDSASADGALVTISAAAPCNRPVYLFKPNVAKGVPLEFSFTESTGHKCCPRSV